MSAIQRRFNYNISITNENGFAANSATVYSMEIPTYTREVNHYINNKRGSVITPQKEVPQEFTFSADLFIEVSTGALEFHGSGTGDLLADLYALRNSDYDTVNVDIHMIEEIAGDEVVTWEITAEDCHVTAITADTLQADDGADVVRATITMMPTVIKSLKAN